MTTRHTAAASAASAAVTVVIEGITLPATFSRLPDALAALWEALRILPLGWAQYEVCQGYFGPEAVGRVEEALARDGRLVMAFVLAGRSHTVTVEPARR
ncbi:hypothetical protein AB0K43_19795 [Kitasatospora sp. NPDC049258]|uniref:hypothetical protein n=1 Tax=Kitasatospora sp. NPDC049258 TaxID=3155394 RepID=UPI0034425565